MKVNSFLGAFVFACSCHLGNATCLAPFFREAMIQSACSDNVANTPDEVISQPASPAESYALAKKILHQNSRGDDIILAYELMTSAAAADHAEAMNGISYFYLHGVVVDKNRTTAMQWLRKGAALNDQWSKYNLSMLLLDNEKDAKAVAEGLYWLEAAAQSGLAEGQFRYGEIFYLGLFGVAPDYGKALSNYRMAAEHGVVAAQFRLGQMYQQGLGLDVDVRQAESWYRKSASGGNAAAQYQLGLLFFHHTGVQKRIECTYWLMLAAEQKHVEAQKLLDEVLLTINEKDLAEACIRVAKFKRQGNASQMVSR